MKKFIKEQVLKAVDALEVIIGILLSVCIAISVIYLIFDIKSIFGANNLEAFNNYLSIAFNFVIGIEFIKMLCKHTPETVIEVLLFAIARQLIVEHMTIFQNLIGVIAIAGLFATRKYLFYNFSFVISSCVIKFKLEDWNMKILLMKLELRAEWVHSLKEKRMVVLSLTKRLSNKFNVSVSEVQYQDIHQQIGIGICAVATSKDVLSALQEKILDFVEDNTDAELIKIEGDITEF